MEVFYDKIDVYRKKHKLTLDEFCSELGIVRATYWNWKKGKSSPSEVKIRSIARVLKVRTDEISTLPLEKEISTADLSQHRTSWLLLGGKNEEKRLEEQKILNTLLEKHQRELRQSSILVRALLSSMKTSFYVKGADGKFIFANEAFYEMVNISNHIDIVGLDDYSIFSKNDAEKNNGQDLDVLNGGMTLKFEDYTPNTRKKRWSIIYKTPIIDNEKKIAGVIGAFVDITDRKKDENLRKLLEACTNASTEAIVIRDIATNEILYRNDALFSIFGMDLKENHNFFLSSEYWLNNIVHPADREQESEYLKKRNWPQQRTYRVIINGDIRYLYSANTIENVNSKNVELSIITDVTEKIKSDETVFILKKAFNEGSIGVFLKDKEETDFSYISESVARFYGYPLANFYNDPEFWLNKCLHPDEKARYLEYKRNNSWPDTYVTKVITSTGEIKWVEQRVCSNKNFYLNIETDITGTLDQHKITELLKKSLDDTNYVIFLMDKKQDKFLYISKEAENLYGYSREKFYNDKYFWLEKCLHPNQKEEFLKFVKRKDSPRSFNLVIIDSSEVEKFVESKIYETEDYLLVTECEVTSEIKQMHNVYQFTDLSAKYKTAYYGVKKNNINSTAIIENDKSSLMVAYNNGLQNITGYSADNFVPGRIFDFWYSCCIHPDFREIENKYFRELLWPKERTYKVLAVDGSIKTINSILAKEEEDFIYFIDHDITGIFKKRDLEIAEQLFKSGINDEIILQTTALSPSELEVVKKH